MKVKLDHVGILVERLDDEIIKFYREMLGCEGPKYFHVRNSDEEMNYAYLLFPKGDNDVESLASLRSPSKEYLERKGPGTMFELCVEVDNIEEFYDEMKAKGITLCETLDRLLSPERKWCSIPGDDNKYAYLPTGKSYGTTIEILERNTWKRSIYS